MRARKTFLVAATFLLFTDRSTPRSTSSRIGRATATESSQLRAEHETAEWAKANVRDHEMPSSPSSSSTAAAASWKVASTTAGGRWCVTAAHRSSSASCGRRNDISGSMSSRRGTRPDEPMAGHWGCVALRTVPCHVGLRRVRVGGVEYNT